MAFFTDSESTFSRHYREEVAIAVSSLDCVLNGEKAIYASTELTTGKRLYDTLREYGLKTADQLRDRMGAEWFRGHLWNVNVDMAVRFARDIRGRLAGALVITPAPFTAPGWNQTEYLDFWKELLRTRIKAAWFNANWQFSNGCTFEFAVAHEAGVPTHDEEGNTIPIRVGMRQISDAVRHLEADGFDASKLRQNLERLLARDPQARELFPV